MTPWKKIKPDAHTKVGWKTIVKKTFNNPDGTSQEFDIVDPPNMMVALVIAITDDNKVIVTEQFRPGPEQVMLELPGGFCEPGESPDRAIVRELHEETGYVSDQFTYLGKIHKDAYSNNTWHYYLAKNCRLDGQAHLDDGEYIQTHLISVREFIENARNDMMTDVGGVFLAYEILKEMEKIDVQTD